MGFWDQTCAEVGVQNWYCNAMLLRTGPGWLSTTMIICNDNHTFPVQSCGYTLAFDTCLIMMVKIWGSALQGVETAILFPDLGKRLHSGSVSYRKLIFNKISWDKELIKTVT